MTRKHFAALAAALASRRPDPSDPVASRQWGECMQAIASVCASCNPNFDRARFLAACGAGEG